MSRHYPVPKAALSWNIVAYLQSRQQYRECYNTLVHLKTVLTHLSPLNFWTRRKLMCQMEWEIIDLKLYAHRMQQEREAVHRFYGLGKHRSATA